MSGTWDASSFVPLDTAALKAVSCPMGSDSTCGGSAKSEDRSSARESEA